MADLGNIAKVAQSHEDVKDVEIHQPGGAGAYLGPDGRPATVGVVGFESATYKRNKGKADRTLAKEGRFVSGDEYRRHHAAGGIVRWSGWEENGKPLECSPANALKLLAFDHILYQVESAIRRDADFFESESAA